MRRLILVLVAVAVLAGGTVGCCTVPPPPQIERTRVYDAPYGDVWQAAVMFSAESSVPVATLEKDSGLIVFQQFQHDQHDAVVHCAGWLSTRTSSRTNGNIVVSEVSEGTLVQVNLDFAVQFRSGTGGAALPYTWEWMSAHSKGRLERMILDGIEYRLED